MKKYEDVSRIKMTARIPKVIRLDGKAFHTFLRNAAKPYDIRVDAAMVMAAREVMRHIGGSARFAYTQSDECSIVLNDGLTLESQAWFDNNIQKMVSVASSIFTMEFNRCHHDESEADGFFDARVIVLPDINELTNYLVWRQADAIRNSIQQYGRHYFSQNELQYKTCEEIKDMMKNRGFVWETAPAWTRLGTVALVKEDCEYPHFVENREFVSSRYLPQEEPKIVVDEPLVVK